jgi:hypothetical protein
LSINTTHAYALHIDTTALADGTYELVPKSKSEQRETQVNQTEVAEDPDQSLEEAEARVAHEGKLRSMNLIFGLCNVYTSICLCFSVYRSLLKP